MIANLAKRLFKGKNRPKGPSSSELMETFSNSSVNFVEFILLNSPKFTERFGDIIRISNKQYIATGPNVFKHMLKVAPTHFTKQNRTYYRMKEIFGNGLIVTEGSLWERHRHHLQPAFQREQLE